jgi:uncharacterized protein (DUF1778 family)
VTIYWTYIVGMKQQLRRKAKADRKEYSIRLRLTGTQKEAFTKAAEQAGLDLSGWLRSVAVREATSK